MDLHRLLLTLLFVGLLSPSAITDRGVDWRRSEGTTCGVRHLATGSRIMGGETSPFGAWPWQVAFIGPSGNLICGGALLNEHWVISAGHCFVLVGTRKAIRAFKVVAGEHDIKSTNEPYERVERSIAEIVIHPDLNNENELFKGNDLALVRLAEPIEFSSRSAPHIAPICLASPDMRLDVPGVEAVATGWGITGRKGNGADVLQQIRLKVVRNQDCELEPHPNDLCTKSDSDPYRTICNGDSGGSLQVRGADGRWYLVGITSRGGNDEEGSCMSPNFFERIPNFLSWIKTEIEA